MIRAALALVLALSAPACSSAPEGSLEIRTDARAEVLSAARLAELPQVEVEAGGRRFSGPRLRDALAAAGVPLGGDIEAIGADGYRKTIAAAVVGRDDVVVALGLPTGEGPLRIVVPGSPGLGVKQVTALRAAPAAP